MRKGVAANEFELLYGEGNPKFLSMLSLQARSSVRVSVKTGSLGSMELL